MKPAPKKRDGNPSTASTKDVKPINPAIHEHKMLAQEFESIHGTKLLNHNQWTDANATKIAEGAQSQSEALHKAATEFITAEVAAGEWLANDGKVLGWTVGDLKGLPEESEEMGKSVRGQLGGLKPTENLEKVIGQAGSLAERLHMGAAQIKKAEEGAAVWLEANGNLLGWTVDDLKRLPKDKKDCEGAIQQRVDRLKLLAMSDEESKEIVNIARKFARQLHHAEAEKQKIEVTIKKIEADATQWLTGGEISLQWTEGDLRRPREALDKWVKEAQARIDEPPASEAQGEERKKSVDRAENLMRQFHDAEAEKQENAAKSEKIVAGAKNWLAREGKLLGKWTVDDLKHLPNVETQCGDNKRKEDECEIEIREQIDAQKMRAVVDVMHSGARSALCISGGGIRSATFALGVLQAFAGRKLLGKFHYLSTVSGGGYIGSWLTAWIHHETSPGCEGKYYAGDEGASSWETQRANAVACVQRQLVSEPEPDPGHAECIADPITPSHPEPKPLEHLRADSNYLSPRLGLLSGDSWTLVAIYLRNLLLNWLVIVPWLFVALLAPRLCVQTLRWAPYMWNRWSQDSPLDWRDLLLRWHDWHFALLSWLAIIGMVWAVAYMVLHAPSALGKRTTERNAQGSFLGWCLTPFFIAGSALTVVGYLVICETHWLKDHSWVVYLSMGALGAAVHLVGTFVAEVLRGIGCRRSKLSGKATNHGIQRKPGWGGRLQMLVAILASGAIAGALWVWLFSHSIQEPFAKNPEGFACMGSGLFLLAFLAGMILFIGLTSRAKNESRMLASDADREWWARAGAWMLLGGLIWITLSGISLYGPRFLQLGVKQIAAIGGVSGLVTVLLGFSAKSGGKQEDSAAKRGLGATIAAKAPVFAAPVFLVFLLVMVSLLITVLFYHVDGGIQKTIATEERAAMKARILEAEKAILEDAPSQEVEIAYQGETLREGDKGNARKFVRNSTTFREVNSVKRTVPWLPSGASHHQHVVTLASWPVLLCSLGGFTFLGLFASFFVNVNLFSLHGMYRDRLIRAYLAASRPDHQRKENPFTGFDDDDNLQMFALWPQGDRAQTIAGGRCLFHVINSALNLVAGEKLAWQERMAASFTITPLHCGSAALDNGRGYRRTAPAMDPNRGNKTPDELAPDRYGGGYGITLGTAMTISGAAVNSNWGYHSSPVVTFLLTLFNARLGWWLGNPSKAGNKTYKDWFPKMGIGAIFHEALGMTNERYRYVDLSDGGHFDNMGLYEMVRRRCRVIVLIDGEADGKYTYEGLGMAIRKIRIDFGISIEFPDNEPLFVPKDADKGEFRPGHKKTRQPRSAIGSIKYCDIDGSDKADGVLLYIKPVCYGLDSSEPRDVVQYQRSNPEFPHESTLDQFFSESQFESYRALGNFTGESIYSSLVSKLGKAAESAQTGTHDELQKFMIGG